MASLTTNLSALPSCSFSSNKKTYASVRSSKPAHIHLSTPNLTLPTQRSAEEPKTQLPLLLLDRGASNIIDIDSSADIRSQLYIILEEVVDRIEMHHNIGEQRDNWNTLLLNSINSMTLAATTMVGLSTIGGGANGGALQLSSFLLFSASTGMLTIMNKIQPSQLAEEQRNATRLFKNLEGEIRSKLALREIKEAEVEEFMDKVLALDRAYPLPLLGKMLEKFPEKFEPATWRPASRPRHQQAERKGEGWSGELEAEMMAVVEVIKRKDIDDYVRLGNLALKASKVLAASGPVLTALAAVGSASIGQQFGGPWAAAAAMVGGAMAVAVNSLEHGGQVGMVLEMYRNCAGFFGLLGESIEAEIDNRSEDGELFEMKVALQLGRSLPELRDLAKKSVYSRSVGIEVDEFASKLF